MKKMNMESANEFLNKTIEKHPELQDEVLDLYYWMISEIESGESKTNEVQLFITNVEQLIEQE